MNHKQLVHLLNAEIERSTGCTDPGAVCLAVATAVQALDRPPERVQVIVSPNVYKNGISVGVPGTGKTGLHIAAALGMVLDRPDLGLAILDTVTPAKVQAAEELLYQVQLNYHHSSDPLTIKATVFAGRDQARVVIANDYSNVVHISRNDAVIHSSSARPAAEVHDVLGQYPLDQLAILINEIPPQDLEFFLSAAQINLAAAELGLMHPDLRLGPALHRMATDLPAPHAAIHRARTWTAVAAEARMLGLKLPIMAISGSGNHGIVSFLGVLAVAKELDSSSLELARALVLCSTITVYIKERIKRMTAFCGCSVAAAPGVAAGVNWLLGGDWTQAVHAMQTVVGTLAGMVCDGAKASCAYKVSTAAATAVQAAYLARENAFVPAGQGIVGPTIEQTFQNLGLLNNPGMVETDKFLIELIGDNHAS